VGWERGGGGWDRGGRKGGKLRRKTKVLPWEERIKGDRKKKWMRAGMRKPLVRARVFLALLERKNLRQGAGLVGQGPIRERGGPGALRGPPVHQARELERIQKVSLPCLESRRGWEDTRLKDPRGGAGRGHR